MKYRKAIMKLFPIMGLALACSISTWTLRGVFKEDYNITDRVSAREKESKRIAVVNLDEGVSKKGKRVNYAERISRFPGTNFEYASLEAARNGLRSGRFGAYIIIPAVFSKNVESINTTPQVSQLEYAVNKSCSGETQYELLYSVLSYLDSMNNNLSYMYVNNVLKEFHEAQDSAENIMENDARDKAAIDRIRPQDLVALVEVPQMRQEESTAEVLNLSGYTAKNTELAGAIDEEYLRCVHDIQSQIARLQEGGTALSGLLKELSAQAAEIQITVDEEGESITERAEAELAEELSRQAGDAPDRESISSQLKDLKDTNEELKRRLEQSNRIYYTNLTAEIKEIRQQYLSDIQQNLPAFQLEYDTQGNLVLALEQEEQEKELPSITFSYAEDTGELTYSGDPGTLTDYIREECTQADSAWELTGEPGLLYDDEDQPVLDAQGNQRLCASMADDSSGQIDSLLKEVEEAKDLDEEKIKDLVKREYIEPVEGKAENVKKELMERYEEETASVTVYQEQLASFRPQVSDQFVTRNMDELVKNHTLMQEALTKNNLEHKEYADKTAKAAQEHVTRLKEQIEEAKEKSDEAVEDGLSEAKKIKEETSLVNQTVLDHFSRKLLYTRLGSAENTQVCQFMASPIMTADQSQETAAGGVVQYVKERVEKEDYKFPWTAVSVMAGLVVLALAAQIVLDIRRGKQMNSSDRSAHKLKKTGRKRNEY